MNPVERLEIVGLVYADVVPVAGTSVDDIDDKAFSAYFDRRYGQSSEFSTLTEHASHILPYRGMGSGIPRALEAWPQIDLVDDPAGNQFSAAVWRPEAEWAEEETDHKTPPVTDQVTDQVGPEVGRLLSVISGEMTRAELQEHLGMKHVPHFRNAYLRPALDAGLIELTIPDKPNSRLQKYRLTEAGKALLKTRKARKE